MGNKFGKKKKRTITKEGEVPENNRAAGDGADDKVAPLATDEEIDSSKKVSEEDAVEPTTDVKETAPDIDNTKPEIEEVKSPVVPDNLESAAVSETETQIKSNEIMDSSANADHNTATEITTEAQAITESVVESNTENADVKPIDLESDHGPEVTAVSETVSAVIESHSEPTVEVQVGSEDKSAFPEMAQQESIDNELPKIEPVEKPSNTEHQESAADIANDSGSHVNEETDNKTTEDFPPPPPTMESPEENTVLAEPVQEHVKVNGEVHEDELINGPVDNDLDAERLESSEVSSFSGKTINEEITAQEQEAM